MQGMDLKMREPKEIAFLDSSLQKLPRSHAAEERASVSLYGHRHRRGESHGVSCHIRDHPKTLWLETATITYNVFLMVSMREEFRKVPVKMVFSTPRCPGQWFSTSSSFCLLGLLQCLLAFFAVIIWEVLLVFNGEGNGNPLQYSCLENPMDGGAW